MLHQKLQTFCVCFACLWTNCMWVSLYINAWTGPWRENRMLVSSGKTGRQSGPSGCWAEAACWHPRCSSRANCLSALLKGKAAVLLPSALRMFDFNLRMLVFFQWFSFISKSGLVLCFSLLVSDSAECIDPCCSPSNIVTELKLMGEMIGHPKHKGCKKVTLPLLFVSIWCLASFDLSVLTLFTYITL